MRTDMPVSAGMGGAYCESVNKMHEDPEGMRMKVERSHCEGELRYSAFVSAALLGVTSSIDFTGPPE